MMYLPRLVPIGLAAYASAQALTDILAANSAALSTLTSLLQTVPDVISALSTVQNVTIFAPSNDAFAKLMARNPRSAELSRNPRALTAVLQYHVLLGRIPASDFTEVPKFPSTLLNAPFANVTGGQRLQLAFVNNGAMLFSGYKQAANVVTADVGFNGGLIHIIDTVLTVPPNVAQTAVNTGLTSLAGAATAAQLLDGLNSLSDLTIFAPNNDAFEAIGSVVTTLPPQTLAGILNYHVLPRGVRFSTDLIAAGSPVQFTTSQGQNLTVSRLNGQLFVNSARILIPDIITANGVVHVIDNVLNPQNTTAAIQPDATPQPPAFAGVSSIVDSPFTSGIVPTATFVPASVPLSAGTAPSAPMMGVLVAGGMAVLLVGRVW
ncbi:FAS1 domain-containing protein [Schizothecium vesticola]|uniref:FAS1 domain-containing protein n=1 Tax=Schizothecium vesticola TaxID=314040 RepID=A0AA40K8E0_9PEZI|nr:FAS1 domain-containing protein [Schizothecium vesticola]